MAVKWFDEPEDHDYDAAADYLSMVAEPETVRATVRALRHADMVFREAKDILRAAELVRLTADNPHVRSDLAKIADGKKLSPILLVRGSASDRMQIADGYHRVCASYLTDENTAIPCRLVSWVSG
jgi:indole-3-glycerol phosphate synthase